MSFSGLMERSTQSFSQFLALRDSRERAFLVWGGLAVIFGMSYALLIDPAMSGCERLNKSLPELRQQVAQMRALSKEAASFSAKTALSTGQPIAALGISKENIETALSRKGLKPQNVVLTGDFAKVQLVEASFSSTLDWLDDTQKSLQLTVIEANVVALVKPDMVNATITLRQIPHE